jgi:hypothetical protein
MMQRRHALTRRRAIESKAAVDRKIIRVIQCESAAAMIVKYEAFKRWQIDTMRFSTLFVLLWMMMMIRITTRLIFYSLLVGRVQKAHGKRVVVIVVGPFPIQAHGHRIPAAARARPSCRQPKRACGLGHHFSWESSNERGRERRRGGDALLTE